ncbi:MAG: pyroglutamyl-peptidase I [Burkholderiaceae bacterium]
MPESSPDRRPARPVVLLTGFDPFNGSPVNPSWQAVQALNGRMLLRRRIVSVQLPTAFGQARHVLDGWIDRLRPELVVCVGQAGGRPAISLERVAINVDDATISDNAGARPVDCPVESDGPAAYFTTLPVKAMLAALTRAGLPAEVSQTAGTFVCNHVFYSLMHRLATDPSLNAVRGGFVHVPWLPEQGAPSMAQDDIVRALRVLLRCALQTHEDLRVAAGATH